MIGARLKKIRKEKGLSQQAMAGALMPFPDRAGAASSRSFLPAAGAESCASEKVTPSWKAELSRAATRAALFTSPSRRPARSTTSSTRPY